RLPDYAHGMLSGFVLHGAPKQCLCHHGKCKRFNDLRFAARAVGGWRVAALRRRPRANAENTESAGSYGRRNAATKRGCNNAARREFGGRMGPAPCRWAWPVSICLVGAAAWASAQAQGFPQKPIRFVVPFPPGGATDALARILGEKMTEAWSQQVVID